MEEEEDQIVKEIPVYLSKQLADQLYVYQYPLRPAHLKFDTTVIKSSAIKPQHQEVKLDVGLNVNSINFNMTKAEEIAVTSDGASGYRAEETDVLYENNIMDKQSFVSTKVVENCSKYAVGVVHGNEIHITPVKGIVQLRPDFPYLDRCDKRAHDAKVAASMENEETEAQAEQVTVSFAKAEDDRLKKIREQRFDYLRQKKAEEPWCHTKWHHPQSDTADLERLKLLADGQDNVGEALHLSGRNYLGMLVPPDRQEASVLPSLTANVFSLKEVKTLPLLEQCRSLITKTKIITFKQLMMLLAGEEGKAETVLRTLPQVATIIRGCWVVRSHILYPKDTHSSINGVPAHIMCRARDYILYLFTENQYVDRNKVCSVLKLPPEEIKEIFTGIARYRNNRGWELLLPVDHEFIEKYPDVIQRQTLFWKGKQTQFNDVISDYKQERQQEKLKSVTDEVKQKKRGRSLGENSVEVIPPAKKVKSVPI